MSEPQIDKQALLARIDALLEEAFGLPRTKESWERRQEIEWELVLLFRQMADLSGGPLPYWTDPMWKEPTQKRRATTLVGRRRDRQALPPPYWITSQK